jgi:hypothetical protein
MPLNTLRNWCRCSPLPAVSKPWTCGTCGGERRYHEKLTITNGGIVDRCGQCRWDAQKRKEPESSVATTLCREVDVVTQLAGEVRGHDSYWLCDRCCDDEIARMVKADVFDHRQPVPAILNPA